MEVDNGTGRDRMRILSNEMSHRYCPFGHRTNGERRTPAPVMRDTHRPALPRHAKRYGLLLVAIIFFSSKANEINRMNHFDKTMSKIGKYCNIVFQLWRWYSFERKYIRSVIPSAIVLSGIPFPQ